MRIKRFASAVLVSLALAACGQGDSGNVMAPDANTLSAAQIDAALGPDGVINGGNAAAAANDVTTVGSVPADAAPRPVRPVSAPPEPAPPEPEPPEPEPPEPEPANESADETETDNQSTEL